MLEGLSVVLRVSFSSFFFTFSSLTLQRSSSIFVSTAVDILYFYVLVCNGLVCNGFGCLCLHSLLVSVIVCTGFED